MCHKALRGGGQDPKLLNQGFDCTQNEYISDFVESKKRAFTLAETLITLTILGVVAAITVPSLINKQIESANRAKVKKAMAVYEKALNQMIIDNDLKTNEAIISFGAEKTTDNKPCGSTRPYFKTVEDGTTNCRFKTSDRVWWDITDIEHPIIMLKDDYKTTDLDTASTGLKALAKDTSNRDVYGMVGELNSGVVRINDKGVATGDDATILSKLYGFMNNEKKTSNDNNNSSMASDFELEACTGPYANYENCKSSGCGSWIENGICFDSEHGATTISIYGENGRERYYSSCNAAGTEFCTCRGTGCNTDEFPNLVEGTTDIYCSPNTTYNGSHCIKNN